VAVHTGEVWEMYCTTAASPGFKKWLTRRLVYCQGATDDASVFIAVDQEIDSFTGSRRWP
jgi:hypothetical protein